MTKSWIGLLILIVLYLSRVLTLSLSRSPSFSGYFAKHNKNQRIYQQFFTLEEITWNFKKKNVTKNVKAQRSCPSSVVDVEEAWTDFGEGFGQQLQRLNNQIRYGFLTMQSWLCLWVIYNISLLTINQDYVCELLDYLIHCQMQSQCTHNKEVPHS